MNILDLITKKVNQVALTEEEYNYFVTEFTNDRIPDYQASAFLMAIRLTGTTADERYYLTKAMLNSGVTMHPKATNKLHILIDKHSSGGVGDKVSLILAPILAVLGYDVAKLSGRGLAFTGGTIDKLESVGVDCEYDEHHYQEQIDKNHFFLMMQGAEIVPADKKMYALRDVTGTVDSVGLIAASIMSKKLAIETDYIFLDIKVGNGAFCKDLAMAEELSEAILDISKRFNRKTIIHLTQMSTPLGKCVGNRIEVLETVKFLQNEIWSANLKELIYSFVTDILLETNVLPNNNVAEATKTIDEILQSKVAYECFLNYVNNQHGDAQKIRDNTFWEPKYKHEITAPQAGYVVYASTKEVGMISAKLGAGRFTKGQALDFNAGIYLNKEENDFVNAGEVIATLYSDKSIAMQLETEFLANVQLLNEPLTKKKTILKVMK